MYVQVQKIPRKPSFEEYDDLYSDIYNDLSVSTVTAGPNVTEYEVSECGSSTVVLLSHKVLLTFSWWSSKDLLALLGRTSKGHQEFFPPERFPEVLFKLL